MRVILGVTEELKPLTVCVWFNGQSKHVEVMWNKELIWYNITVHIITVHDTWYSVHRTKNTSFTPLILPISAGQ